MLSVKLMTPAELDGLVDAGILPGRPPANAVAYELKCPHLEQPVYSVLALNVSAPAGWPIPAGLHVDERVVRLAVCQWEPNSPCGCPAAWWMHHGEELRVCEGHAALTYSSN